MGILQERDHLKCEQCDQRFSMKARRLDVEGHLSSHETGAGELQDCIICHCDSQACPNYGKDNFFDLREKNGDFFFVVHQHNIPMCEHMWRNAKKMVDLGLESAKDRGEGGTSGQETTSAD
jgi:hypothetical protein